MPSQREIDFLPDRIRAQRSRRRRLRFQVYAAILCVAGLMAGACAFHGRVRSAQGELDVLARRAEGLQAQLDLRDSLEAQMADLLIKRRIEEQLGRRVTIRDVLAELQRVLPETMALTNLSMETVEVRLADQEAGRRASNRAGKRGLKKTDQTTKRVRLLLTGLAPTDVDVANFIGQLSASPLFEDVNMGYAKNVTFRSRGARAFQASCYVVR